MSRESSDLMDIESISSLSTSIATQPIHQETIDKLVSYAENSNSEIKKKRGRPKGPLWNHFEEFGERKNGHIDAKCN